MQRNRRKSPSAFCAPCGNITMPGVSPARVGAKLFVLNINFIVGNSVNFLFQCQFRLGDCSEYGGRCGSGVNRIIGRRLHPQSEGHTQICVKTCRFGNRTLSACRPPAYPTFRTPAISAVSNWRRPSAVFGSSSIRVDFRHLQACGSRAPLALLLNPGRRVAPAKRCTHPTRCRAQRPAASWC
jgi:hypothetical protein